jgi:energy-coupling factor transporter ATP-binding protein EcfA2
LNDVKVVQQDGYIFHGRQKQISALKTALKSPQAIVLLSPRACGKTALLKRLPQVLTQTRCVYFDLQDNPLDTVAHFITALLHKIDPLAIPDLCNSIEGLQQVLDQPRKRTLLLCFDEYESLYRVLEGRDKAEWMAVMDVLLQARQNCRVLFAGATLMPLKLSKIIRFSSLNQTDSVRLLKKIVVDNMPQTRAKKIAKKMGGQPFLLQHYAKLCQKMDLEDIEETLLDQCGYYFRSVLATLSQPAQQAIIALAEGQTVQWNKAIWQEVKAQHILNQQQHFNVPLFARFLAEID